MAKSDTVTPTQGAMSADEHTAFLLRILMHLVAVSPGGNLEVDLNMVAMSTANKQLDVELDGPIFRAKVIPEIILPPHMRGQ